ncbi:putative polyprotein [Candida dubliniensis CD36]|uniref:Polyprotein n=1 Tax=Candida dubliniensis (strain CD36 / ATCC MYA-646 / CBS 7987 / NCPF 3949 / NRRL Y-17841) TaxID=573826 RepID=B9WCD6_CANDC|nr:putative polyprotein [Candida dubliniensis CD36]CAX44058.1 putative polyprotein [Candida dubliniensis CD36]
MLSRDFTKSLQLSSISISLHHNILGEEFFDRVKAAYTDDKRIALLYSTLINLNRSPATTNIHKSIKFAIKQYTVKDGLLFYKGINKLGNSILRLVIPTAELQLEIVRLHHDSSTATHYGPLKVLADLSELYYLPNMYNQIKTLH